MQKKQVKTLRLILGDQLNDRHSWFKQVNPDVIYCMMEIRSETDYVKHHIQKVIGFFAAMRCFSDAIKQQGHQVIYLKIDDPANRQTFTRNILYLIETEGIDRFEYQEADEYRVEVELNQLCTLLPVPSDKTCSEHFFTERDAMQELFPGQEKIVMESFYRMLRRKHNILMEGTKPLFGQWNFDQQNRKKLPAAEQPPEPLLFQHDVQAIYASIQEAGIETMGSVNPANFTWPLNREESLRLLSYFIQHGLKKFGTYQDAMTTSSWAVYHSRLSFSLNVKLLDPHEVIQQAVAAYTQQPEEIAYNQLEGFVRQILGWREYMRAMYWKLMPDFSFMNFFQHQRALPTWFWNGKTQMRCLHHAIQQSLEQAYAHHIQRLMLTGNFLLLAEIAPDEVDAWYLGIYMDALEWVEITNTRGMSQYADGGLIATKPYISSAAYIQKMSSYCSGCHYLPERKIGERACPMNSLYWRFLHQHQDKLQKNPRMAMMYQVWNKMTPDTQQELLTQANAYLTNIENL